MSVRETLTAEPRARGDHDQYLAAVARMLRAAGRRVGNADEPDLASLFSLRIVLDDAITEAIELQRRNGKSWSAIASAAGTTRQSAHERYGRPAR